MKRVSVKLLKSDNVKKTERVKDKYNSFEFERITLFERKKKND